MQLMQCQLKDENGVLGTADFNIVPVKGDWVIVENKNYLVIERILTPTTLATMPTITLLVEQQEFIAEPKAVANRSILNMAGAFKDDPLFEEFVEDMAEYRRELDAQVANSLAIQEE